MIRVAVTITFDLLHAGHIDHLEKASKLGDKVIIIVDPDEFLIKKKGYALQPLESRMRIAQFLKNNIPWIEDVVVSIDKDGTCAETLRMIAKKYDNLIFVKGGDRVENNMPLNEIKVCNELGIKIIFGVGDILNSSQALVRKAVSML